jgi:hypothetical protein
VILGSVALIVSAGTVARDAAEEIETEVQMEV